MDPPTEEHIEKMIKDAATYADENKKAKERVHAENAFAGYLHSMKSATEGSGENKGLSEKIEGQEKEKVLNAIKDGLAEATGVSHGRARRRGGGRVHDRGVSPVGNDWA